MFLFSDTNVIPFLPLRKYFFYTKDIGYYLVDNQLYEGKMEKCAGETPRKNRGNGKRNNMVVKTATIMAAAY